MKIAFLAKNDCGKYSGGRLHVFTMAQALVSVGHEVDYYTNVKPIFYNIYSSYIEPKISWSLNIFLLLFNINKYNLLVVAPHLTSKKNWLFDAVIFYPIVRICKIIAKCKIAFIDFESPNWACKNISSRVPSQYYFSNKIIRYVDLMISTTKTGMYYSKKYYMRLNSNIEFMFQYLAINSFEAEEVGFRQKKNRIIFFGRFKDSHKGADHILSIIQSLPDNYELLIIGNDEHSRIITKRIIENNKMNNGCSVQFASNINERDKFILLSESKALLFISDFEGYGIPPVEAQYVGTPTICSDIPVLREVNKDAIFISNVNKQSLQCAIKEAVCSNYSPHKIRLNIYDKANFKNYSKALSKILTQSAL